MRLKDVKIDPEFEKMLVPLTEEALNLLKADIVERGCHTPIVVWRGKKLLLDGHHRRIICMELGIEPPIALLAVGDRVQAKSWIVKNQIGRRNQTSEERALIVGRLYNEIKGLRGRPKKGKSSSNAAITLGEEYKLAPSTVRFYGKKATDQIGIKNKKESKEKNATEETAPKATTRMMIEVSLETKAYIESKRLILKNKKKEPIGKTIDRLIKKLSAGISR